MKRVLIKRWYKRRFTKARAVLEDLAKRHRDSGHEVYLNVVDETTVHLSCINCPELQPLRRKAEDVVHITVDSRGRPYR